MEYLQKRSVQLTIILITLSILVLGGIGYSIVGNSSTSVQSVQQLPPVSEDLDTDTIPKDIAPPHADIRIDSIVPSGAAWGQAITIKGTGFKQNTVVHLRGETNTILLWQGLPISDNEIKITIPSSVDVCIEYGRGACSKYKKTALWGTYDLNIDNVNGTSNSVKFEIFRN